MTATSLTASVSLAPSREGGAAGQSEPAEAAVDPGQGAGLAGISRDAAADARARPAHRLRGGGLPEYRRVLEGEARDGDDPGRGLHPRLHLLQCRDRAARPARPARAGAGRRRGRQARPQPHRRDLGRPRRSRRWRRRAFRADHRGDPRRRARRRRSRCWSPISCARTARSRPSSRPGPTCSTTISKPCRGFMPRCGRARAISIRCACWTRPSGSIRRCSPNRASWSGSARSAAEVLQVMDDLRAAQVDFLTIGQYLQPTPKHHADRPLRDPGGIRQLSPAGARQRVSDGLGVAADPLVLSCRRRFRPAARGPRRRSSRPARPRRDADPCRAERVLPYTPEQLFALVADIERYPEFLPWCVGARITRAPAPI